MISILVTYPVGTGPKPVPRSVCPSGPPGTRLPLIGLLQWLAIVGLGAGAVYLLRYEPPRSSSSVPSAPLVRRIPDGATEVGHDAVFVPDEVVTEGGRAAGT